MKAKIFASVAGFALLVGISGCGATPSAPVETPEDSRQEAPATPNADGGTDEDQAEEPSEGPASEPEEQKPAAPSVDRATLPWNDEVPPEFPLEDIPLPTEGTMDYAELVEEDVWNVMISDIPQAVHEVWIEEMVAAFKVADAEDLTFMGPRSGGVWFSIHAMVFEETDSGITMAYRIKDMGD